MKGLSLVVVLLLIIILLAAGLYIYTSVTGAGLPTYLSSTFAGCGDEGQICCPNDWCSPGFECEYDDAQQKDICKAASFTIELDESYMLYNSSEAATKAEFTLYLNENMSQITGVSEEFCENAKNCKECEVYYNFTDTVSCNDCETCDASTGECTKCLECESTASNQYEGCFDCYYCSLCDVDAEQDTADFCGQCALCEACNTTNYYTNEDFCSLSDVCNQTTCEGNYGCGTSLGLDNYVRCKTCDRMTSTTCEYDSDYTLCQYVKNCIAYYENEPCIIEHALPSEGVSIDTYRSQIRDILDNCVQEDVLEYFEWGGTQKLCDFVPSKLRVETDNIFIQGTVLPLDRDRGVIITDCGYADTDQTDFANALIVATFGFPVNRLYTPDVAPFDSSTAPSSVHMTLAVSDVVYNEAGSNICDYNFYMCSRRDLADASYVEAHDNNPMRIYRFFRDFNVSYNANKYFTINVSQSDIEEEKILRYEGHDGNGYFTVNVGNQQIDSAHIGNLIVAGLRDWAVLNFDDNATIEAFCVATGIGSNISDCIEKNISVHLMGTADWELSEFSLTADGAPSSCVAECGKSPWTQKCVYDSMDETDSFDIRDFKYCPSTAWCSGIDYQDRYYIKMNHHDDKVTVALKTRHVRYRENPNCDGSGETNTKVHEDTHDPLTTIKNNEGSCSDNKQWNDYVTPAWTRHWYKIGTTGIIDTDNIIQTLKLTSKTRNPIAKEYCSGSRTIWTYNGSAWNIISGPISTARGITRTYSNYNLNKFYNQIYIYDSKCYLDSSSACIGYNTMTDYPDKKYIYYHSASNDRYSSKIGIGIQFYTDVDYYGLTKNEKKDVIQNGCPGTHPVQVSTIPEIMGINFNITTLCAKNDIKLYPIVSFRD